MIRILSVEDDVDLQRLLALALADEDLEVHYAFTGPEGFEKALTLHPHVILCDLMLPIYPGRELIAKLKAEAATRDIPIIVITAYYDSATFVEEEIRRLGVIEYLRKPVRTEDLERVFRCVAALPRSESQPPRPQRKASASRPARIIASRPAAPRAFGSGWIFKPAYAAAPASFSAAFAAAGVRIEA